jgi:hypothetical protein
MERVARASRTWRAATRLASRANLLGWLPHVAVGLIAVPLIASQNAWFEWANPLWLLKLQTAHIAAYGTPTFFIDASASTSTPRTSSTPGLY